MIDGLDYNATTTVGGAIVAVATVAVAWINARPSSVPTDARVAEASERVAAYEPADLGVAAPLARVLEQLSERSEELADELSCVRTRLTETEAEIAQLRRDRDEDRDALRALINAWRAQMPEVPLPIRPPAWYTDHPHYPARGLS